MAADTKNGTKRGAKSGKKISQALTKDAPYRQAAELLIKTLEAGVSPWQQPWVNAHGSATPRNAVSNRTYSSGNLFVLYMAALLNGYDDPRWLTYKQAAELGAQVRGGEKGTHIYFYAKVRKDLTDEQIASGKYDPVRIDPDTGRSYVDFPMLRSYTVFNAAQCDRMPPLEKEKIPLLTWDPIERAESVVSDANPQLRHEHQNCSCYHPIEDYILMPLREQFPTAEDYYSTLLHELGHWTGHQSRLNRDLSGGKHSKEYAREELTAELISIYMAFETGIKPKLDRSAAYIDSWLRGVSVEDLTVAMNGAARATRYLLPQDPEHERNLRAEPEKTPAPEPETEQAERQEQDEEMSAPAL